MKIANEGKKSQKQTTLNQEDVDVIQEACFPVQGTMVVHAVAQQVAIHHLQKM